MPVREIPDFRVGRQVTKGKPTPTEPLQVTVVPADEADDFFHTRSRQERVAHVRGLEALGLLVRGSKGGLTCRVRTGEVNEKGWPVKERCYVFRCRESEIPRKRRRAQRLGVTRW